MSDAPSSNPESLPPSVNPPTQPPESLNQGVTRRDFLKIGAAVGGGFLAGTGLGSLLNKIFVPENNPAAPDTAPQAAPTVPAPLSPELQTPTQAAPIATPPPPPTAAPTVVSENKTTIAPTTQPVKKEPTAKPTLKPATKVPPTATKEAQPTIPARSGRSLDEAIIASEGQTFVMPPYTRFWLEIGKEDKNKIQLGLKATQGSAQDLVVQIYSDDQFNEIREFEAKRIDKLPNAKGAGSQQLVYDRYYDGGHGKGQAWKALTINNSNQPLTFRVEKLVAQQGYCADKLSGHYYDGALEEWYTCDETWLRANGITK